MKFVLPAVSASLLLVSPTVHAVPEASESFVSDPRIIDALTFYMSFCVSTGGLRDPALKVLGSGNEIAARLPDAAVRQAQGQEGGVAWAVRSPRGAAFMLGYTSSGICEIRIADADEKQMVLGFQKTEEFIAKSNGMIVKSEPPISRIVDGTRTTYFAFTASDSTGSSHFALTSAEKPAHGLQHLLTFTHIK